MNMLAELRNDILNFVMPLLGQEIPLRIAQVIEVCWSDDRRPQLHSKKKTELGYDFYYCLPVGITFKDFLSKKDYFRDAIGTHCTIDITHTGKMVTLKVVAQQLKEKYLYCWEYDRSGGELVVPIGYTHNQLVTVALEKIPHVLCGGTTGLGKSNFIHLAAIMLCFVSAAAFTNPSKQQYVGWAKQEIINSSGGGLVGILASMTAPTIVDGNTTTSNYFVFSTYTTKIMGEEFIALGAFNNFIPVSKVSAESQGKK